MTVQDKEGVFQRASACATHILSQTSHRPRVGFVLGSGLGAFAESLKDATRIDYTDIPGFYATTVPGHAGQMVLGLCGEIEVVAMSGRFHFYEGHDLDVVTFPVRVLRQMGVRYLFVTNSAGGINPEFEVGDLMIISDHLNFTGNNPLTGANIEGFGPRFPDMSRAYAPELCGEIAAAASDLGVRVRKGVYTGVLGPSYETPAEIRMFRTMGGDAVGMSTVPEVIVANHAGMTVAGISCISNMAAGMLDETLSHDDVKRAARLSSQNFVNLLLRTVERMKESPYYDWDLPEWAVEAASS